MFFTFWKGKTRLIWLTVLLCKSFEYLGNTYTQTEGIHTTSFPLGCDSVVIINLTILQPVYDTIYATACNAFVLNDSVYLETGEYTQYLLSDLGCDSILTVRVVVNEDSEQTTIEASACGSYIYNGIVYTSSGNYIQILDNAEGCDSLIRLNIVISNLRAEIIKEDTILKATTGEASYQWINCITGLPVSGETSQTFNDPQPGSYAVIISDGICTDTSDCVVISATADYNSIASFDIKPNPANEGVWIVGQAMGHSAKYEDYGYYRKIHNGQRKHQPKCTLFGHLVIITRYLYY